MTAIIIITFNIHPDIFILQMEAIKQFCQDEKYAIEIIDNSDDPAAAESIKYHAAQQGANYTRVRAGTSDASYSHSFAANFAYAILQHEYLAFFDHDLIPVKPFSVKEILGNKLMAGLAQDKAHKYFWPGLFMFDNARIENGEVDFSPIPGLDTGGSLHRLIDKYGMDECVFFNEAYHQNPHFPNGQYNYYTMLHNETFMHFINASNWNQVPDQQNRMNSLINIARERIKPNDNG